MKMYGFYFQIHNNRLSRCRRLIENSFGILASTWRILLRRIDLEPNKVSSIAITACILHNLIRSSRDPPDGALLEPLSDTVSYGSIADRTVRGSIRAINIRDKFKDYVNKNPIMYLQIINCYCSFKMRVFISTHVYKLRTFMICIQLLCCHVIITADISLIHNL